MYAYLQKYLIYSKRRQDKSKSLYWGFVQNIPGARTSTSAFISNARHLVRWVAQRFHCSWNTLQTADPLKQQFQETFLNQKTNRFLFDRYLHGRDWKESSYSVAVVYKIFSKRKRKPVEASYVPGRQQWDLLLNFFWSCLQLHVLDPRPKSNALTLKNAHFKTKCFCWPQTSYSHRLIYFHCTSNMHWIFICMIAFRR